MHNWEAFYNTYFDEARRAYIGRWTAAHGDASAKHMLSFVHDGSQIIGMVGRNADHPLLGTVERLCAGKMQQQHPAAAVVANCSSLQPPPTRITTSMTPYQHTTTHNNTQTLPYRKPKLHAVHVPPMVRQHPLALCPALLLRTSLAKHH